MQVGQHHIKIKEGVLFFLISLVLIREYQIGACSIFGEDLFQKRKFDYLRFSSDSMKTHKAIVLPFIPTLRFSCQNVTV